MPFRENALAGQHIVISGGVGAIGLGIVKKLTDHSAIMTVNDVLPPDEALKRLRDYGVKLDSVHYVQGDLTRSANVQHFVQEARIKFGPIQTALCHVGIVIPAPLIEFKEEDWDQTMAVNVKAA